MARKIDPFIRKALDANYCHVPFEQMEVSTATVVAKLTPNVNLNFKELYNYLPVIPKNIQMIEPKKIWPAGSITGSKHGTQGKGLCPTSSERGFKNCTMIWMWLREKQINVKISATSFHMTGCKTMEQAAEAARLLQLYIVQLSKNASNVKFFDNYPFVISFEICMINYNFNLECGLDLEKLDLFIAREFPNEIYSSYDHNIHGTTMPMKCPLLSATYTIHDNGQICMCISERDIETAMLNVVKGHKVFYAILDEFKKKGILCI